MKKSTNPEAQLKKSAPFKKKHVHSEVFTLEACEYGALSTKTK